MPSSNRNRLILALDALISLALIAFILHWVGLEDVLSVLGAINLFFLGLSIVFLIAVYAGMMTRIRILLESMGYRMGWQEIGRSHWVGMLLADFTPARTGYFATAAALKRFDVPSEKALLSIFGPQIYDFALKLVAGTMAIYYLLLHFLKGEDGTLLFVGSVAMAAIVAAMLLLLFSSRFLRFFAFVGSWPIVGRAYALVVRMQVHSPVVIQKTPEILLLMLFTWTMKSISWFFVAKSLGISIDISPFPELAFYYFFQPLITMLEFMPSPTLAGIGLSEGGSTLVMTLFGVSPAAAAAFALVARFKTTLVNLVAVPDAVRLLHRLDIGQLLHKPT